MRKLTVLLTALSLCVICVAAGISGGSVQVVNGRAPAATHRQLAATIDGAKNPELISDEEAYALLFRLISNRPGEEEKSQARAYIRHLGLGNQKCQSCPYSSGAEDADIDSLISVAEEFHERVKALDKKAAEIKDTHWPNPVPDVMPLLENLQREKEGVLASAVAALPMRLSDKGLITLRRQLQERIKRRVKIEQTPQIPPTEPSWHHSPNKRH